MISKEFEDIMISKSIKYRLHHCVCDFKSTAEIQSFAHKSVLAAVDAEASLAITRRRHIGFHVTYAGGKLGHVSW